MQTDYVDTKADTLLRLQPTQSNVSILSLLRLPASKQACPLDRTTPHAGPHLPSFISTSRLSATLPTRW